MIFLILSYTDIVTIVMWDDIYWENILRMFLYLAVKWYEDARSARPGRAGETESGSQCGVKLPTFDDSGLAGVPAVQILHKKLLFSTFKVRSLRCLPIPGNTVTHWDNFLYLKSPQHSCYTNWSYSSEQSDRG